MHFSEYANSAPRRKVRIFLVFSPDWPSPKSASLNSQRLVHGIDRIGAEAGLEFGEQFAGDGGDVLDAGHRQKDEFGSSVERDLKGIPPGFRRVQCCRRGSCCRGLFPVAEVRLCHFPERLGKIVFFNLLPNSGR